MYDIVSCREMHDTIIIALDKNIDWLPKVDDFTYCPGYNNWKAHKKLLVVFYKKVWTRATL